MIMETKNDSPLGIALVLLWVLISCWLTRSTPQTKLLHQQRFNALNKAEKSLYLFAYSTKF